MHVKNQNPIFVPAEYRAEIEKLSKATLMDMVWDFATQCTFAASEPPTNGDIMKTLRANADIITTHRRQARAALKSGAA